MFTGYLGTKEKDISIDSIKFNWKYCFRYAIFIRHSHFANKFCLVISYLSRRNYWQLIVWHCLFSVVMCVASCAFSYWVTISIKKHLEHNYHQPQHVHVTFSYSFYLVVSGGICALLACAFNMVNCNCRRNRSNFSSEEELTAELMNSMEAAEPSSIRGEPPPVYSV